MLQKKRPLAVKLKKFFNDWNDLKLFIVCFWSTVLHRIHKTSKALQSESVNVLVVENLYASLEEYFNNRKIILNTSSHWQ